MPKFTIRMTRLTVTDFTVEATSAQEVRAKVKEYGVDLAFSDFPNPTPHSDTVAVVSVTPEAE